MSVKIDFFIVLDGMLYEGGWNNINLVDVEFIFVLKDVVFIVFYGVWGVNGVIIIIIKLVKVGDVKIIVDVKWSVNICGEIEYDYIKDLGEYY